MVKNKKTKRFFKIKDQCLTASKNDYGSYGLIYNAAILSPPAKDCFELKSQWSTWAIFFSCSNQKHRGSSRSSINALLPAKMIMAAMVLLYCCNFVPSGKRLLWIDVMVIGKIGQFVMRGSSSSTINALLPAKWFLTFCALSCMIFSNGALHVSRNCSLVR